MTGHALPTNSGKLIAAIRYSYPGVVFLYFMVASTISVCVLQTISSRAKDERVRRDLILWLMLSVLCLYIIHAVFLLIRSVVQKGWDAASDEVIYLLSSAIVWGLQFLALLDSKFPVWYPYYVNWVATIIVESGLLTASSILKGPEEVLDYISTAFQCARIFNFLSLCCTYSLARGYDENCENNDEERQSLLRNELAPKTSDSEESGQSATEYGTTKSALKTVLKKKTDDEEADEDMYFKREREGAEKVRKRLEAEGNWWNYCKAFFVFLPMIWPIHSKSLQFRAVLTGACLLTSNSLNLLVPRQLGVVIDALVTGNGRHAWTAVAIYAVLNFLNSNACIGWLQFWLWQPLDQYSYDAINVTAHAHVMSLSSEFHENRTSGDIHQTISQGKGIRKIVNTLFFNLIPTFIDLFLVFLYLYYLFGPYMALNLAATTIIYLYTTAKLVAYAAQRRRVYHTFFRKEWMSALSSIGNWRVASYFNQIRHEHNQHHSNIKAHLRSEKSYEAVYYITSVSQNLVMTFGLLGACLLAVYQVLHKVRSPGDFIILLTYWAQLRTPLATFSNLYKSLSEGLMDAERMLEIFQTKPKVIDADDATPLELTKGDIQFRNVKFAYDDRKETLKGINLKIEGGSTVAIVGETGSGKSTILKLLHRFYDVKGGSIEIDGQDIRKITTKSLRESIAVVPQEPTLFNETIMSNLRYAKLTATNDEIYEACKSAEIHDKIMSMPDAYEYKIGNTATKLSGGEQQRLAIARAILKSSAIILLDEATSAVDTETEQKIQEALNRLCHGHTTVIVAHRLSTIMRADHIVVMKNGSIIEHGSHEYLLRLKGKYFDLWANQISLLNPDDKSDIKSVGSRPASPLNDKASRMRSRSPQKVKGSDQSLEAMSKIFQVDEAGIINDLGAERNEVELLKLADIKNPAKASSDTVMSVSSKHRKPKASIQNLFPYHLCGDRENGVDTLGEPKKGIKKQEDKVRKSHASITKRAAKNAGKVTGHLSDIEEPKDVSSSRNFIPSGSGNRPTPAADHVKNDESKWKRPRTSGQRNLSESEPAGQDGTNDCEDQLALDLGESQPLLGPNEIHNRRILPPNKLVSKQQDSRSLPISVRSRRTRHWRIKNRSSNKPGSALNSVVNNSVNALADKGALPKPPATSSAGGLETAGVEVAVGPKLSIV